MKRAETAVSTFSGQVHSPRRLALWISGLLALTCLIRPVKAQERSRFDAKFREARAHLEKRDEILRANHYDDAAGTEAARAIALLEEAAQAPDATLWNRADCWRDLSEARQWQGDCHAATEAIERSINFYKLAARELASLGSKEPQELTCGAVNAVAAAADLCEGTGNYLSATSWYQKLEAFNWGTNAAARARKGIKRCREELDATAALAAMFARARDHQPRPTKVTFLDHQLGFPISYSLTHRDGLPHVNMDLYLSYRGEASYRDEASRAMKALLAEAQAFYTTSSLSLEIKVSCDTGSRDKRKASHYVRIWQDFYSESALNRGTNLALAQAQNWPVQRIRGQIVPPTYLAHILAHEVGHLLGLHHYDDGVEPDDDRPGDLMMRRNPWWRAAWRTVKLLPSQKLAIVRPLYAPTASELVAYRAYALMDLNQMSEVGEALKAVPQGDDATANDVPALQACRTYYLLSGEKSAAVHTMILLGRLCPDDWYNLYLLANELSRGRAHDALALYNKILNRHPNNSLALMARGSLLISCDDPHGQRDVDRVLEIDPYCIEAWCVQGNFYLNQHEGWTNPEHLNAALKHYRRANEIEPSDAGAAFTTAKILSALSRQQEALAVLGRLIESDPPAPDREEAYRERYGLWQKTTNWPAAIQDCTRWIEWQLTVPARQPQLTGDDSDQAWKPDRPVAHALRGDALRANGDVEAAIRDFSKARELAPKWNYPANSLAWIYATEQKFLNPSKAVELASIAVSLQRDANNVDTLACAYAAAGDFSKAMQTIEEAITLSESDKYKQSYRLELEAFKQKKTYIQMKQAEQKGNGGNLR